jgi:hypothetical protein
MGAGFHIVLSFLVAPSQGPLTQTRGNSKHLQAVLILIKVKKLVIFIVQLVPKVGAVNETHAAMSEIWGTGYKGRKLKKLINIRRMLTKCRTGVP